MGVGWGGGGKSLRPSNVPTEPTLFCVSMILIIVIKTLIIIIIIIIIPLHGIDNTDHSNNSTSIKSYQI